MGDSLALSPDIIWNNRAHRVWHLCSYAWYLARRQAGGEKELKAVRLTAILAVAALTWWQGTAIAAVGIGVSPAYQEVHLSPKQTSQEATITFYNRTPSDRAFKLSTADFGTLDESGGVAFLGQSANELDHKYGLSSWMRLSTDNLFIPAGLSREITVTIDNRQSLAPGGHYGAVLATNLGETQGGSGADVGVKQVLSALILLNKDGGAAPQLKLVKQTLNGRFWHLPTQVVQRFQNSGNVHLVPRGTVEIKDPAGQVVERAVINEESGVILPESFRRYTTKFMAIRPALMPGAYRVTTLYRYDGVDTYTTQTSTIWYAGQALTWLTVAIVCFVLGAIAWLLLRRHNRRRK